MTRRDPDITKKTMRSLVHRARGRRDKKFARISVGAALLIAALSTSARADDAQDCHAAGAALLTGRAVSPPTFKHGMFRHGVELSHTHLRIKGDAEGKTYDIAIDSARKPSAVGTFTLSVTPSQQSVPRQQTTSSSMATSRPRG